MNKPWYESKTIQGIVLAALGGLWGLWAGESEISKTVILAGLAWTGIGARFAVKK